MIRLQLDHVLGIQRRLLNAKELSDALVLEVLQICANRPWDDIPGKYVLMDHCHNGAWDQAALWVHAHSFPSWTLQLDVSPQGVKSRLVSPHAPPFIIEAANSKTAVAIFLAQLQALSVLAKLGLDTNPR